MLVDSRNVLICLFALGLSAISSAQDEADRKPLFGELHIHTMFSFDAYAFNTRATPDDAYNFAKGKPLKHPLGKTFQLKRPLDFMSVTDHGIFMGVISRMADETHPLSKHPIAKTINDPDPSVRSSAFSRIVALARSGDTSGPMYDPSILRDTWDEVIASANRHYEPGKFTTFIGYEWSTSDNGMNMHRNVIFKGDDAPVPFTRADSQKPEDLWMWMDGIRVDGYEALAIPHNSNKSDGRMFERETSWDTPFSRAYADQRNRNEPLVEVTQVKGTSETHPMLSPNDEFANFEIDGQRVASPIRITKFAGSYVRDSYRTGLEFQDTMGFNPYRFGLMASTDSHTGITPLFEKDYSGKLGTLDGSAEVRIAGPRNRMEYGASGLAGVWSKENTRESIYDSLRRKETWGTTGPRIIVRFFGGFDMKGVRPGAEDWIEAAYAKGVSMGGALKASDADSAPTFAVWAVKDAESANLDRIQIVKGWSQNGKSEEKVYDVSWSGDRSPDSATGKLPAVGNTVDLKTATYSNSIGAVELTGIWQDPDFNPEQNAFYYVRVLEIPTPRWNLYDEVELGKPYPADLARTLQERAYTSPIWYDHH
ncbi:MAG: DUF3604 domain-containing protein [Candidatus Hydrogenedentota bacterium]